MKKGVYTSIILFLVIMIGCEKVIEDPVANPFGGSDANDTALDTLDPIGIEGLHQNIFSIKCANPTCHDGSFEPDFRTIQSTYSSLVYHPLVKNDDNESFTFRVIPGQVQESWLIRRVEVDDVLGRMPLYAEPLSAIEIQQIKDWILAGAKNIDDSIAAYPNLPPSFLGYVCIDSSQVRLDRNRLSGVTSPFIIPQGTSATLAFLVEDDNTKPEDLMNQRVDFSYIKNNYNISSSQTLTFLSSNIMITQLNADDFVQDSIVYFRYYGEDQDGASTSIPNSESPFYLQDYLSFIVQ